MSSSGSKTSFGQDEFVPNISLIGDFSYVTRDKDSEGLVMSGLTHSHSGDGHGHSHAHLNEEEGFNLNYAEVVMESTVDPYLDMTGVFHLSQNSFEIEEIYAKTRGLPYSLGLKIGKFFSNFGRLNSMHHHVWNFADQPLINNALLGEHGINETGIGLNWLAPTDFYLDIGVELLKGENENSFGNQAIVLNQSVNIDKTDAPNLKILYVKIATDIGDTALLAGISYADGESRINHLEDGDSPHAFAGDSTLYGADITLKMPFDAYSDLTWTTEYLKREMDGDQFIPNSSRDAWGKEILLSKEQSGFYSSVIYKMDTNWRMGLRYDDILENDIIIGGDNKNETDDMNKYSAMLEYNFSEFNRLRLQYNRDNSKYDTNGKHVRNDEIILQMNLSIGSHGSHSF
jgi:hypothetical protein